MAIGPKNIRENQSLKAQGLPYRFPKTIGGESGEIADEWETHTVQYWADGDFYGILLEELAVKGSGIPAPLIYRKVGNTYTELTELPLSTIPPVGFYAVDYHGTGFESTSRVYMHEDMNGWTIVVKRYAGLGRVPRKPRKNGFVQNRLTVTGEIIGNETAYAGGTIAREQLALKGVVTEGINRRYNLIEHGIADGKSRIVSWSSHYRPQSAKFRDVSFLSPSIDGQRWHGSYPNAAVLDAADAPAQFTSIAYGGGVWVAVAQSAGGSTSVYSSENGIKWTRRTAAQANNWNGVAYGDGWFVAIAASGSNRVMRSQDGISWSSASATEANAWNSISYGDGRFVAVASTGSSRAMYSDDAGATWSASNPTDPLGYNTWNGVSFGNGIWVVQNYYWIMSSTDGGETWGNATATPLSGVFKLPRIAYGNGFFVLLGYDYSVSVLHSFYSPDGITWSAATVASTVGDFNAIAFGAGLHAIAGEDGAYLSSDGGATWTPYPGPKNNLGSSGTFGQPVSMVFAQSMFSVLCRSGVTAHSEKNFADDAWLSIITDIDDEASPSVNREVYTYILYKQADA